MALRQGERVGPYAVGPRIGAGGMGEVYRATDTRLGREVALKVLRSEHEGDPLRAGRLEREARTVAALSHPNIVAVFNVGSHQGSPYVVTELLEGTTLRQLLAAPVPLERAVALARQIAAGLAAAHAKGVVHRDLKPENLFVTSAGLLKILDFGIARLPRTEQPSTGTVTEGTDAGAILGTVGYMAPEQVRGQPADPRADLFAFGCVLYELLCGRRAFQGATPVETGYAILNFEPEPLSPGTPPHLVALVHSCLQKPVERRVQSAAGVEAALDGARVVSSPARSSVRPRRHRGWPLLTAVGVLALGAGGGWTYWKQHRVLTLTDLPVPHTNDAARVAYQQALRQLRTARESMGVDSMKRAAELDPQLGAAQLRLATWVLNYDRTTDRRRHLAAAIQLQGQFDERERALLELAKVLDAETDGSPRIRDAARQLTARFPNDVEMLAAAGVAMSFFRDSDLTVAENTEAVRLDPAYATGWAKIGDAHRRQGKMQLALEDAQRCLAIAPEGASCIAVMMAVESNLGRCTELVRDARKAIDVEPLSADGHERLALALAANGASIESVRVAFDRWLSLIPEGNEKRHAQLGVDVRLALLAGDFDAAVQATNELEVLDTGDPDISPHDAHTFLLMDIAEEEGDWRHALELADAFEKKSAGWQHQYSSDTLSRRPWLLERAGRLTHAELEAELAQQKKEWLSSSHLSGELVNFFAWVLFTAWWAWTPEELAHAVAEIPPQPPHAPSSEFDMYVPLVLARAGKYREAAPLLQRLTTTCTIISPHSDWSWNDTLVLMQAQSALGTALEATGDRAGACAAFGTVRQRWKNARPRSVSLETANARYEAMKCSELPAATAPPG